MNETWLVVSCIALSTVIITVVIWQAFKTYHLRIDGSREAAYHKLAEETAESLRRNAEALDRLTADSAETRARIASIEAMLKEVG